MSPERALPPTAAIAGVADRLLAHARLCEQIADECWSEETAEKLRLMARDCARTAAEITPLAAASPGPWH